MLKRMFYHKNIGCAYLYFYVHFIVEIMCFYFLGIIYPNILKIWFVPFIYDAFAFVPQAIIGYYTSKYSKYNIGLIGIFFLIIAIILLYFKIHIIIPLLFLSIGNAIMHVCGAEVTLRNSQGKLSHPAIFVAGGSFGVITGKILASIKISPVIIILIGLTMIPFYLLANTYNDKKKNCHNFNYANTKISPYVIIILAVLVVIMRGFVGYGIPTSWNKSLIQNIIFYCTMGVGKALGGILADYIGFKKISIISTILSIPFLCFGDNNMYLSIIGIMFFSMTMALSLGLLVSVLKNSPGLAFGLTTIGLFLGSVPIFFIKITSITINIILLIISSLTCCLILVNTSRKKV